MIITFTKQSGFLGIGLVTLSYIFNSTFISLCKISSNYSYTLILAQRGWVIIHYYQTCVISYLVYIIFTHQGQPPSTGKGDPFPL